MKTTPTSFSLSKMPPIKGATPKTEIKMNSDIPSANPPMRKFALKNHLVSRLIMEERREQIEKKPSSYCMSYKFSRSELPDEQKFR